MTDIERHFPEDHLSDEARAIREQFSHSIIENVNVWLNVLDLNMNIAMWNATAEKISGYTREEVLGHARIWEWLYPDEAYRQQILDKTQAMLSRPMALEKLETRIRCKNGEMKTITWNSRFLIDDDGDVYGAITFGYDITHRQQAEEALQKAHDELSVLYDVASVASESIDLSTILNLSLERVLPIMKSRKGTIHLWDSQNEGLRLAAYKGLSFAGAAQLSSVSLQSSLIGRVWRNQAPLTTSNIVSELDRVPETVPDRLFHSYLGVPMRAKGEIRGVFSVLGKAGYNYSTGEINLLTSIADQVGVAVENARLYEQERQLAVAEERRRLARDLHDSVTQSLYSLTLFAEASQRLVRSGEPQRADRYLARVNDTALNALKEMRMLIYELRPLNLQTEGIVEAIQHRLDAVERRVGIKAHLLADNVDLPAATETEIYYIVQEALNNVLRHANAGSVNVRLRANGQHLCVEVEDGGAGFDVAAAEAAGGMGLANMRERAARIGWDLHVDSAPGRGTTVQLRGSLTTDQ
ncbi:MAG: PAS domain S-box protein [bacterium]